jgi:four helix bundle protein
MQTLERATIMPFRFEGLEIWQMAREYSDAIYKVAAKFPDIERYSLGSQVTRAANSICLNIAEGSGRDTSADFSRFLSIALGSTFEVASALILAADRGYLDKPSYDNLYDRADKLGRSISNFRRSLGSKR